MDELLNKAFDFGVRIVELANYLEDEKKLFPLMNRLHECAGGICVSLRVASHMRKNLREDGTDAYRLSLEAEYLLELMVKTGFLSERQSGPILTDCRFLKAETETLLFNVVE